MSKVSEISAVLECKAILHARTLNLIKFSAYALQAVRISDKMSEGELCCILRSLSASNNQIYDLIDNIVIVKAFSVSQH